MSDVIGAFDFAAEKCASKWEKNLNWKPTVFNHEFAYHPSIVKPFYSTVKCLFIQDGIRHFDVDSKRSVSKHTVVLSNPNWINFLANSSLCRKCNTQLNNVHTNCRLNNNMAVFGIDGGRNIDSFVVDFGYISKASKLYVGILPVEYYSTFAECWQFNGVNVLNLFAFQKCAQCMMNEVTNVGKIPFHWNSLGFHTNFPKNLKKRTQFICGAIENAEFIPSDNSRANASETQQNPMRASLYDSFMSLSSILVISGCHCCYVSLLLWCGRNHLIENQHNINFGYFIWKSQ